MKRKKTFVFFFLLDVLTFCFQFYRPGKNECRTEFTTVKKVRLFIS